MEGIGPKLPLQRDVHFGNYDLITLYSEEVKQNFKNLLLTSPGERIMNPDFGVGLRNFLFEPKKTSMSLIRQRIEDQVRRYLPFIRINKLIFNEGVDPKMADDSVVLSILIEYDVPSLNLESKISIESEVTN